MSKTLEEIITSPSLVRENWLPTELAVREVLAFERRFGLRHLKLACHAALPLILSPELVNLIHLNFLEGEGIPWVAEVDLLLSPLCRPVDEGLYEVEPAIREVLLVELENQFGWERPFTLAKFLEFYLARKSGLKLRPQIIREHPNYVMSINAQKGKKAFVITILVPITQFREPLKIYELPKRLAI
jgi:hypothetical protein